MVLRFMPNQVSNLSELFCFCLSNVSKLFFLSVGKRGNRLALHVQFFGDRGRRSWVLTTSLIKYESKEQFLELKVSIVSSFRKNYVLCFSCISSVTWTDVVFTFY